MERPSVEQTLADVARTWARRATCPDLQVGCVIARRGHQLTAGYNGAPRGVRHCDTIAIPAGRCRQNYVSMGEQHAVVHAEANAVAQAALEGISLEGGTCVVTHRPCLKCAMLLAQAGVYRILWIDDVAARATDATLEAVMEQMRVEFRKLEAKEVGDVRAEPR